MAQEEAYSILMQGIQELTFKAPPVPSELSLNGPWAFPLALNSQSQVIIAASCYGKGRVVVLGHEAYLHDFPELVQNALGWLKTSHSRSKVVGVHPSHQNITSSLPSVHLEVCQFRSDLGVFVTDAYVVDPIAEDLVRFLREGGGILIAGQAWHWASVYPQESLQLRFPGNKVSRVAGICFTKQTGGHETVKIPSSIPWKWLSLPLEGAYSSLLHGIQDLSYHGSSVPCQLLLNGLHAFPLAVNAEGKVIMAASCYGLGRIVVLAHESYLWEFPQLIHNVLLWLQPAPDRAGLVGVHPSCQGVGEGLASIKAEVCQFRNDLGVYVTNAYSIDQSASDLVGFLKEGGGILLGGQAWHWASVHPEHRVLLDFPGNRLSGVAGIYFTEKHQKHGELPVPPSIPLSWSPISRKENAKEDLVTLLNRVFEFDVRGDAAASEVLVHGPLAFPIGTTPDGKAFLAGAQYGLGRVVVATHESFLTYETLSTFVQNALRWLDQGRNGTIGVAPRFNSFAESAGQAGLPCQVTDFRGDLSVFVCTSYSDDDCESIQAFVAEGGGLLVGGHAWWWASNNSASDVLTKYPGNTLLNPMGLSILGNIVKSEVYQVQSGQELVQVYEFRQFLPVLAEHIIQDRRLGEEQRGYLQKMGRDCADYLTMSAHNCATYSCVLERLIGLVKTGKVPQVCDSCPVSEAEDRMLIEMATEVCKACPDPQALLPYIIKDIPSLATISDTRLSISANTADQEEWISTGLYLSPGMKTDVVFPSQIVGQNWKVQIGCQSDDLGKLDVLKRAPVVCERFAVDSEVVPVWNVWGGLIYLVAPPKCDVSGLEIVVKKAVQAPYYKSGRTSVHDWVMDIRSHPGPWAELEFENLVITLSSEFVRGLDRPDLVAEQWDAQMRAVADLASIPAKLKRKERFVADVQISAGFMHSGYPIMMHKSSAPDLLKLTDKKDAWGPLHELGHNQQRMVWEFPPHTTEATCNLWSVFILETVLGQSKEKAQPTLEYSKRVERILEYIRGGRSLDQWSVFLALETYLQLQETFGWDAIKNVFAAYHTMEGVPGDNKGKMNKYAETFSIAVNKNLSSFFKAWGWPIEGSTEQKLSTLPNWSNHPMTQFA